MPDQPESAKPVEDPFDIGNTDLDLRQPDGVPVEPVRSVPPKDPVTGRFIPIEPAEALAPPPLTTIHPSYLIDQATDLGFSEDDMANMSSEALGRSVRQAHRLIQRESDRNASAVTIDNARVKQPAPADPVEEDVDLGVDESQYDPGLLGAIKNVARSRDQKIKKLEEALAQRDQRESQKELRSGAELVDLAFDRLGEAYAKQFGKGDGAQLQKKDPAAFRRRLAALNEAGITDLRQVSRATIVKKLKAAADTLWGASAVDPYSDALKGEQPPQRISPEQWANGTVARPTSREGAPEPNGEAKAIKNLERKMKEGTTSGSAAGDTEILDTLW